MKEESKNYWWVVNIILMFIMFIAGAAYEYLSPRNNPANNLPEEINLEYEFDGKIPLITIQEEQIPVGIEMPEAENEWGEEFYYEETPLFLLTLSPEYWDEVYQLEYFNRLVVRIKDYWYLITPSIPVSPVWAFARYEDFGDFYGVTTHHCFLFLHHGSLEVVKQGYSYYPEKYEFVSLPFGEELSIWRGFPINVSDVKSICIDSFNDSEDTIVEVSERLMTFLVSNHTHGTWATIETIPITDGAFYAIEGINGDRAFRIQQGYDSYEAIFAAALDGFGVCLRIPIPMERIDPESLKFDQYGIHYTVETVNMVIPYTPLIINGVLSYSEWREEFFQEIKDFFPVDENGVDVEIF